MKPDIAPSHITAAATLAGSFESLQATQRFGALGFLSFPRRLTVGSSGLGGAFLFDGCCIGPNALIGTPLTQIGAAPAGRLDCIGSILGIADG